jgi:hypothetical protein
MAFNTPPIGQHRNGCRPRIGRRQMTIGKDVTMDWQAKGKAATADDDPLTLFVRPAQRELESGELDRVAGGNGGMMVPNG